MKTFFLLILAANFTCTAPTIVYVCNSEGGKKFHYSSTCRGLKTCQHKIVQTTLEKAKKDGKTVCKWEN